MLRFLAHFALIAALTTTPAFAKAQSRDDGSNKPNNQQSDQSSDQKKQPGSQSQSDKQSASDKQSDDSSSSSSSSASGAAQELQQADQQKNYNPLPAEQDVDVGTFYMHKGDLDAAIARFQDAIQLKENYAKPRLLLAQIYEKKHDNVNAVKYYKEYLQVYPHAPDAKKVQEKIEKLSGR